MTLTLELSDETAARARSLAEARGLDLNTFFAVAVEEAFVAGSDEETDYETDEEIIAMGREALEDIRAGRLFTLEETDAHVEAALAHARALRASSGTIAAVA